MYLFFLFLCPAPLSTPHMSVKEAEVSGYTVPADTIVLANIREIHHDPAAWPDPYVFNPDRFLDKGGHFCSPKENFLPFSIGKSWRPSQSVGLRLYAEMVRSLKRSVTLCS